MVVHEEKNGNGHRTRYIISRIKLWVGVEWTNTGMSPWQGWMWDLIWEAKVKHGIHVLYKPPKQHFRI